MSREPVEKTVSEETGRKALDTVLTNLSNTARQLGKLPDVSKLEAFAKPLVAEQFKKHEEAQGKGFFDKRAEGAKPGESRARIDRGDVGPYQAINRPIQKNWHKRNKQKLDAEARLVKRRLALLQQFPEWRNRLMKAAFDGECNAMRSGSPEDRTNWKRRQSIIGDEMMRVIEQSNGVFGDFRDPKVKPPKIIIGAK